MEVTISEGNSVSVNNTSTSTVSYAQVVDPSVSNVAMNSGGNVSRPQTSKLSSATVVTSSASAGNGSIPSTGDSLSGHVPKTGISIEKGTFVDRAASFYASVVKSATPNEKLVPSFDVESQIYGNSNEDGFPVVNNLLNQKPMSKRKMITVMIPKTLRRRANPVCCRALFLYVALFLYM